MFAISDIVWQAIIGAAVTIVLAWMQLKTKNAVVAVAKEAAVKTDEVKDTVAFVAKEAAVKVDEVAQALQTSTAKADEKLDIIVAAGELLIKTTDQIHTLNNSAMGVQLKLNAELSRDKANKSRLPADITEAENAERALADHMRKQAIVDRGGEKEFRGK